MNKATPAAQATVAWTMIGYTLAIAAVSPWQVGPPIGLVPNALHGLARSVQAWLAAIRDGTKRRSAHRISGAAGPHHVDRVRHRPGWAAPLPNLSRNALSATAIRCRCRRAGPHRPPRPRRKPSRDRFPVFAAPPRRLKHRSYSGGHRLRAGVAPPIWDADMEDDSP